jgi:hypothetical protein
LYLILFNWELAGLENTVSSSGRLYSASQEEGSTGQEHRGRPHEMAQKRKKSHPASSGFGVDKDQTTSIRPPAWKWKRCFASLLSLRTIKGMLV